MIFRQIISCILLIALVVQSMPVIVQLASFHANRQDIIEKYCVNIAAPQLECRAACYLEKQIANIGADANDNTPSQHLENIQSTLSPYIVPHRFFSLDDDINLINLLAKPVFRDIAWYSIHSPVDTPPPSV